MTLVKDICSCDVCHPNKTVLFSLEEIGANMLSLPHELFVAIEQAASEIKAHGLHVSAGSWVDVESLVACVFSRETYGPALYNAAKVCLLIRKQHNGEYLAI